MGGRRRLVSPPPPPPRQRRELTTPQLPLRDESDRWSWMPARRKIAIALWALRRRVGDAGMDDLPPLDLFQHDVQGYLANEFPIHVRTPRGEHVHTMRVWDEEPVEHLRGRVAVRAGVPTDATTLLLLGKVLSDGDTVAAYRIDRHAGLAKRTLRLMVQPMLH